MKANEFAALAESIFGGAHGWQSATARVLDVNPRRVREWVKGGTDRRGRSLEAPESVVTQLRALAAAAKGVALPTSIKGPEAAATPEWIIGRAHDAEDDDAPEYIVHTRRPRFVARIVDEAEEGAALGREVHVDGDWSLDVTWLDRQPGKDAAREVIARAFEAIA